MAKPKKLTAIYIATLYLFLGLGWILGSDQVLKWALPAQIAFLDSQRLKALGVVLVSGLAIYVLVLREQIKAQRYQQSTQQTQENYRRIVNSTQQGIWLVDAAGKITFVNNALCELLGYTSQEMVKRPLVDFICNSPGVGFQEALSGNHQYQQLDLCFRHKDGSSVWALASINPLFGSKREFRGSIGMGVNITDRMRTEALLQENETRFRSSFNNSPVALLEVDFSAVKSYLDSLGWQKYGDLASFLDQRPETFEAAIHRIIINEVNSSTMALFHALNKEQFVANFQNVFGWESRENLKMQLIAIASGACSHAEQGVHYTLDGNKIDIQIRWQALPGFEHSLSKVIVSIMDVTAYRQAEGLLQATEARYRALVEHVMVVIYANRVDENTSTFYLSPQVETLTGYSPQCWLEDPNMWQSLIHSADRAQVLAERRRTNHTGDPFEMEYRLLHKDGSIVWVHDKAVLRWDEQTQSLVWQGVMVDTTERQQYLDALRESEARFRLLLHSQGEGTLLFNLQGKLLYVNPAAESIFGVEPGSLAGHELYDFISPDKTSSLIERVAELAAGSSFTEEVLACTRNLEERCLLITLTPWHESDGQLAGGLAVVRDITKRKQDEGKMRFQSTHDGLTGIYNRQYFDEYLAGLGLENHFPVSLVIADMDGLKHINDTFGHQVGDCQLQRAAQLLKESFRSQDIVARVGGDEFAALLPGTGSHASMEAIRRIHLRLEQLNNIEPGEPLSLSVGFATAEDPHSLSTLYQRADQAMYIEKLNRRSVQSL